MNDEANQARDLGQQAGEASQGILPVLGDAIEGLWDGLWLNTPDEAGEVYTTAYDIGSAVPDVVVALWNFVVGFFDGLFA